MRPIKTGASGCCHAFLLRSPAKIGVSSEKTKRSNKVESCLSIISKKCFSCSALESHSASMSLFRSSNFFLVLAEMTFSSRKVARFSSAIAKFLQFFSIFVSKRLILLDKRRIFFTSALFSLRVMLRSLVNVKPSCH